MDDEWVGSAVAASALGLSAAAVRGRIRPQAEQLIAQGLVRKVPAGSQGGHPRWEISRRLLSDWLAKQSGQRATRDLEQDDIDFARREAAALQAEVERMRAENESLRAKNDELRSRFEALGEQFAATVRTLTVA